MKCSAFSLRASADARILALLFSLLFSFELFAQNTPDTTYATGYIDIMKINTNNSISTALDYTFRPLNVQMSNPPSVNGQKIGLGFLPFNLPVYIDTTVSIGKQPTKLKAKVISTGGADLNIFLDVPDCRGVLNVYDMMGSKVKSVGFAGGSIYLVFPVLDNGVYIYEICSDNGTLGGKFIKCNNRLCGRLSHPAGGMSGARWAAGNHSADYEITISDPNATVGSGFLTLVDTLHLSEGNNGLIDLYLSRVPLLKVDLIVHSWDLNGDTIANALFFMKDSQGNIDSLRTDSTGRAVFCDLNQNASFTCGIGGRIGMKIWEGFNITVPSGIISYNDTIFVKNYCLIPDSMWSGKNDTMSYMSRLEIGDMFQNFNIEASLDTVRVYVSSTFPSNQFIIVNNTLDSLADWTGIPIFKSASPLPNPPYGNPYTMNHSLIGTTMMPGTSNTAALILYMPSGPFPGVSVVFRGNMTVNGTNINSINKEMGRVFGFGEVTSYNSFMNPVSKPISDRDIAIFRTITLLGRRIFKDYKQDLPSVSFLRDSSAFIPGMVMMGE